MRDSFSTVALLVAFAVAAVPAAAEDSPSWRVELGLLGGHHDNFFFRGEGAPAPSSDLATVSVDAEYERDLGKWDLTVLLSGAAEFVRDIPNADYQTFSVGAEYKRGPNKVSLEYERLNNRLFSEEGEPSFFDQDGLDLWVRRSFGPGVWVRGRVQLEKWEFDEVDNDRDADVLKLSATLRVALTEVMALRGSLLWSDRDAKGADNNRVSDGYSLALELNPSERFSAFLRFRDRTRQYEDAPPTDRNFRREDKVKDINFNLRWKVGESWGIQFRDSYRDGKSTRPDRNFDGNTASLGVFVIL